MSNDGDERLSNQMVDESHNVVNTSERGEVTWGQSYAGDDMLREILSGPDLQESDDEKNLVGDQGDTWDPEIHGSSQPIPEEHDYEMSSPDADELKADEVTKKVAAAYTLIEAVCGPPPLPSKKRMVDYGRGRKRGTNKPIVRPIRLLSTQEAAALNELDRVETKAKKKLREWLEEKTITVGYCKVSTMATNKNETNVAPQYRMGYVEWSFDGGQKVNFGLIGFLIIVGRAYHWSCLQCILGHRLVCIAEHRTAPPDGFHASHRCHQSNCVNQKHLVFESKEDNEARKNCTFWLPCPVHPNCDKVILSCPHVPCCIREVPGVSEDDYLAHWAFH